MARKLLKLPKTPRSKNTDVLKRHIDKIKLIQAENKRRLKEPSKAEKKRKKREEARKLRDQARSLKSKGRAG